MTAAWQNGTPPEATAVYARWWQLETWLRSLLYVERSARDGREWADSLPAAAEKREQADRKHGYMASPDAQARLAYLDVAPLFTAIANDWELYTDALIEKDVWAGRVVELTRIRHRIGHCRRPHHDDLGRLEQTLRDLNDGTFRAVAAYNRQDFPDRALDDPLVDAWTRGNHDDASRLLDHARTRYGVRFSLRHSRRPWAERRQGREPVTGRRGYFWHARFILTGGLPVDLRRLWDDNYLDQAKELLVYLTANDPFAIELSFAAVDDSTKIADAIAMCFEAVLTDLDHRWPSSTRSMDRWARLHRDLDARVQIANEWAIVDDTTTPISIFGA